MSATLTNVQALVARGETVISDHAYDRLYDAGLDASTIEEGVKSAVVVEDYPDAQRGPSVLVLQMDRRRRAIHVLWGLRKGTGSPAVAITAYRPDPALWSADFRSRK